MTKEEAIKHGEEQLEIFWGKNREFTKVALRSLEAWDDIKTDIDNYLATQGFGTIFRSKVLNIIDKHLGDIEVEDVCKTTANELPSEQKDIDKEDIAKSVMLLDLFTKTFCRYTNDYERFDDLKFRCEKCTFRKGDYCLCKMFRTEFAPDYKDFGCMGDL